MSTVVAQKNLPAAMRYFEEHLSRNDYYPVPEVHQGQWIGLGAEKLGLTTGQEVGREPFEAQYEKRHRHSGEHLTLPQNEKDNRRVFYDFTCASPKLVSILGVTLKGGRPVAAYKEAIASTSANAKHSPPHEFASRAGKRIGCPKVVCAISEPSSRAMPRLLSLARSFPPLPSTQRKTYESPGQRTGQWPRRKRRPQN